MEYNEIMQEIDHLDGIMKEYFRSSSFQDLANQSIPRAILVDTCWLHIRDIARAKVINTQDYSIINENGMLKMVQWLQLIELISNNASDKEIKDALDDCYGTNTPSDSIKANVYDDIYDVIKNFTSYMLKISPCYFSTLGKEKSSHV